MSEALRIAVVRLATDPAAYEELIRDPDRVLACVPTAERQRLDAGDVFGLAAALGPPPVQPAAWVPGWPHGAGGAAGGYAFAVLPAAWPESYKQLPGWPLR